MGASRSSNLSPEVVDETTPKPASAVGSSASVAQGAERRTALLEYFANPPSESNSQPHPVVTPA
jgi:hypothetical protein